jgi:glucosamine--fructose-6-phosphate aminotransferase (isomerizing)
VAGERKSLPKEEIERQITLLREVPATVKVDDATHEQLKRLSKRYLHGHGFFFIGRDVFYPLALEGALKLKEISYLHAEGYPSGEMKHGPIALADPELFTIALLPRHMLYEKAKSNVEELSARDATICAISAVAFEKADDFIPISLCKDYMLEFFEMMVVLQLLALEISIRLGNDVDMPRNLAKSVTVE